MVKRTTIEIDEEPLRRAKRPLSCSTTGATVEEALRRVTADVEAADAERVARQLELLAELSQHIDLDVLASEDMWR
ncbi:MAG: type II toxin-antitoxin system VapB family antitoxin [Ilumatobacteraceae bacterium]